jgi:hypothetical protein
MRKTIAKEIDKLAKQLLIADGNFEIASLKKTILTLFEKVAILEYLEKDTTQNPLSQNASLDSKSYREENWFKEPEVVPAPEHKDSLVEPLMEKIKDLVAQIPQETQELDALLEEILPAKSYVKNDIEEFASNYQETPTFERKVAVEKPETNTTESRLDNTKPANEKERAPKNKGSIKDKDISDKPKSINQSATGSLKVGLNDRIAFTKQLFAGSADDLQRVLSQINTFTSLKEATHFIQHQVKPDYNNWVDKGEFEERFMLLLDKRFL